LENNSLSALELNQAMLQITSEEVREETNDWSVACAHCSL